MGTAPLALRSFLQLGVQTDEVVGPRAGVTQNDLPTLLAHLTVILVICLVAVNLLLPSHGRTAQNCHTPEWRPREPREMNGGGERKRKGLNKEDTTENKKDSKGTRGRLTVRATHS